MNKLLGDKKIICLFILPAMAFFLAIVLIPIGISFYYSLLDWDGISTGLFVGLDNYTKLFVNNIDGFLPSVGNSIVLVLLSTFVQLPIALFLALILASGVRGESFYRTAYFVPVVLSTVVIGQLWTKIYQPDYGLLNTLLQMLGLESLTGQWLADTKTALLCTFVPSVWQYIGYHMLLFYGGIKAISEEIFESSKIDGASPLQTALHITVPLLKSTMKTCVIFAVIGSLKVFDIVYIMTKGGPMHASEVPSTLMYRTIFMKNQYGYGSTMSVFIVLSCMLFTFLIQRAFRKENT